MIKRRISARKYRVWFKAQELYIALAFVVLAGIFIGVSALSFLPDMQINDVHVEGTEVVDPVVVEELVESELVGSSFGLFSNSNRYLLPLRRIERKVRDHTLRIKDVSFEQEGHLLSLHVDERKPQALWCGEGNSRDLFVQNIRERTEHACSYVSSDGIIFERSPQFSDAVFVRFKGGRKEQPLPHVQSEYFVAGMVLAEVLNRYDIDVQEMKLEDSGELSLLLTSDMQQVPWRLSTTIQPTYGQFLADLLIVLDKIAVEKEEKPHADLEYIDMRFGERVYYRFKEASSEPDSLATQLNSFEPGN